MLPRMKTTRCKFRCQSMTKRIGWGDHPFIYEFDFTVVMGGSDENKLFFAATPSGSIQIGVLSSEAFEVGAEYYFDVTVAPTDDPTRCVARPRPGTEPAP